MSPRKKPKPLVDEDTMAAQEDYFYKSFRARLSEKSIDTGGLKRVAERGASDSPLCEVRGSLRTVAGLALRSDRLRVANGSFATW